MENEIILYSHLGLGDQIICVGLVNFLSEKHSKVYVPTKAHYYDMMLYCYKDNPNVEVFKINNEPSDIFDLSEKLNLKIVYAGHGQGKTIGKEGDLGGRIWNVGFYECNGVDYDVSFDYFRLPKEGEEDQKLFDHLMSLYNISDEYILISEETSHGRLELNINSNIPKVYLKRDENIFQNIFFLRKVIYNAKEIHLTNSGMFHLVERLPTKGKIFFHNHARKLDFALKNSNEITLV